MIGAYAQYLGFDPEPLVQHYAQFLPRPAIAPRASHPANPAPLSSAKILTFGKLPKYAVNSSCRTFLAAPAALSHRWPAR